MKKLILIIACILIYNPVLFAQINVHVSFTKNTKGGYSFYAYNNSDVKEILHLYFTEFDNLIASTKLPYYGDVKPGYNYLFDITIENNLLAHNFKYNIGAFYGCLKPNVDLNYPYLLPYKQGNSVKVIKKNMVERIKYTDTKSDSDFCPILYRETGNEFIRKDYSLDSNVMRSTFFLLNYGDTIYAARSGVVTSILSKEKLENLNDTFLAKISSLSIYQNDCSLATYMGIHSVLVENKQHIEAGDPIALAGNIVYKDKGKLSFSVSYYDEILKHKFDSANATGNIFFYSYINPMFYTKEGGVNFLEDGKTYTAAHPEEIITREMTKKERKRWLKKHP